VTSSIQVFRKEVPPLSVRDLEGELNALSPLLDEWAQCEGSQTRDLLFKKISRRLHPNLVKSLVMIARKQTSSILKNREMVQLTYLGRVRLFGVTLRHFMEWVDVMIAEDGTPFLRRVALSEEGMEFFSFTWAGCTHMTCSDTAQWDMKRAVWNWDSSGTEELATIRRDGVLPYLPLHMMLHQQFEVYDWERLLHYSSANALLDAVDRVGKGKADPLERNEILRLLTEAQADMNPLWAHLARAEEYD
jgi:hypothetical protein